MRDTHLRSVRPLLRAERPCPRSARTLILPSLAVVAAVGLAACSSNTHSSSGSTTTTTKQTLPPHAAATPSLAVTNYFTALSHHDVDVAKLFLQARVQKGIMATPGSGFEHLVSIQDIDIGTTKTSSQFRPDVNGNTFGKEVQFAQVIVQYTAIFSSGQPGSGTQTRVVTLGENKHSKWTILEIKPAAV